MHEKHGTPKSQHVCANAIQLSPHVFECASFKEQVVWIFRRYN